MKQRPIRNLNAEARQQLYGAHEKTVASNYAYQKRLLDEYKALKDKSAEDEKRKKEIAKRREEEQEKINLEKQEAAQKEAKAKAKKEAEERSKKIAEEQSKKAAQRTKEQAQPTKQEKQQKDPVWDLTSRLNKQKKSDWEPRKFDELVDTIQSEPTTDQVSNVSNNPNFYSKEDQKFFFDTEVEKRANELFDPQIEEAKRQKEAALAEYDAYAKRAQSTWTFGNHFSGSDSAAMGRYAQKINDADKAIEETQKQKDRYIQTMKQYTDPNQLFQGQVLRTIKTSDVFLDQLASYDRAQKEAEAARGTAFYLWKAQNLQFQKVKTALLGKKLNELSDYLDTLQVLPKSFADIPQHLQDIAAKVFIKDGKSLLHDEKFREQFNTAQVVEKSQFDSISELAKEFSMQPADIDEDFILRKKQEYEILRDLENSKKTYSAQVENTVLKPGSVGSINQYELEAAKKSQAEKSAKLNNYDTAIEFLNKALHYKEINEDIENSKNPFYRHFRAYKEFFWDDWKNTFGFDVPNILNATRVGKAADKFEKGETLTHADTALLEALSIENMAHSKWGKFEDDKAYRWGQISAESLKFMAEFIATRGASAYLQGVGKAASKGAAKAAAKIGERLTENAYIALANKALEHSAMNVVAKYGGASAKWLTNAATRLTADATYAAMLTGSLGAPRTMLDAINDMNGHIQSKQDLFGNITPMSFEDRTAEWDAYRKSGIRNWIENFSEMMGEWGIGRAAYTFGKVLPGVGNLLKKIEQGYTRNLVKDIIADTKNYLQHGIVENSALFARKGLRKYVPAFSQVFNNRVLKAGQFHGFLGEVSEEYYGLMMQHLFGVQDDPNKDLLNDMWDQSIDIWGGIATSTGFLGALSMGHAMHSQRKYNSAVQNLVDSFGEDNAIQIQKMLLFAHPMDLMDKYSTLTHYYGYSEGRSDSEKFKTSLKNIGRILTGNGPMTLEKNIALADYVNSLCELRGAVYGQEVIDRGMGVQWREIRNAAREAGYTSASYSSLQTMTTVAEMLEKDATQELDQNEKPAAELYEEYSGNVEQFSNDVLSGKIKARGKKEDLITAFVAYHNAKSYVEGTDESLTDVARDRVNKRARIVDLITNKDSGKIRVLYTTDENGKRKRKYWIGGDLKTEIGTNVIETQERQYGADSSKKILVSDGTGQYSYIDRSELKGWRIDNVKYDPRAEKKAIIRDETEKEWKRRESYMSKFNPDKNSNIFGPNSTVRVGGKRVTILDNKGVSGITYAISDENGENSEIYYAESVKDLNQLLDEIQKQSSRNITKLFKDQADDMVKRVMSADVARYRQQQAKIRDQFYREKEAKIDENDDRSDSDALTPQQLKEQREREITEARDDYYSGERYRYGDYEDSEDVYEDEVVDTTEEEGATLPPTSEGGITVDENPEPTVAPETPETNLIIEIDVPTMGGGTRKEKVQKVDASQLKAGDFIWYSGPDTETPINTATVVSIDEDENTIITDKSVLSNRKAYYKVVQAAPEVVSETPKTPVTPSGPTAPTRATNTIAPEGPVVADPHTQQEGWDKLMHDIQIGQQQKIHTTGYHYFVNYGGRVRLARRVHSIQEGSRDNSEKWWFKELLPQLKSRLDAKKNDPDAMFKEVEKILEDLYQLDISSNRDKYKDFRGGLSEEAAKKIKRERKASVGFYLKTDETSGITKETNIYLEYLQDYPDEVDDVIEALSNILAKPDFGLSVVAGNIYDTIARFYLDATRTTPLSYTNPEMEFYYYGERVHISEFVDEDTFNFICQQLEEIKKYYTDTLGWKLCTTAYTMCAELLVNDEQVLVAGETDCIAIDEEGKRHIVDFKTYNAKNKIYHRVTREINGISISTPHNLYDKNESWGQVRNVVQEYAEQMAIYKMLQRACGSEVESAEALFFGVVYKDIVGIRDLQVVKELVLNEGEPGEKHYPSYLTIDGKTPNRVNLDKHDAEEKDRGVNEWLDHVYTRIQNLGDTEEKIMRQRIAQLKFVKILDSFPEEVKNILNAFNEKVDAALNLKTASDLKSAYENLKTWQKIHNQDATEALDKVQHEKIVSEKIIKTVNERYPIEKDDIEKLLREYGYSPMLDATIQVQDDDNYISVKDATEEQLSELVNAVINFKLLAKYAEYTGHQDIIDIKIGNQWADDVIKELLRQDREDLVTIINQSFINGQFSYELAGDVVKERTSLEITGLQDTAKNAKTVVGCHAVGDESKKLVDTKNGIDLTSNFDFVKHGEFYVQRDESWTGKKPRFEMVIVYNGVEYTPITINIAHERSGEYLPDAKTLYNKLVELTKSGGRIKVNNDAIHRSFGLFKDSAGLRSVDTEELLGIPLSKLEYSSGQQDVGLTKMVQGPQGQTIVVQVPGQLNKQRRTIYQYSGRNKNTRPVSGGIVLMYKPQYEETSADSKSSENSIPINLQSVNFDDATARFIADLLTKARQNPAFLSQMYQTEDGAITPFTNQQVIEFFISYGASGIKAGKTHASVIIKNGKIAVRGKIQNVTPGGNPQVSAGEWLFDFDTIDGYAKFVEFLVKNVRVQISEDFMKIRLQKDYDLGRWFDERPGVKEIKFGDSPISFTRQDVEQNLSGIAWYLRSGMLKTTFNGLNRPLFSFDETGLLNKASFTISDEQDDEYDDEDNNDDILTSTVPEQDADGTINEEQARQRIKEIVGDVYVPDFEDEVLDILPDGLVVAACHEDMIRISKMAKRGTEYHEAFHRVLELLVSEKTRQRAYKAYRRKFGKDLTDIQIAERAADEFWWFKENKPIKKFSFNLKELIDIMKAWYRFFTKIGSFELYWLYRSAANGKYKNRKPTDEARARFKKLTAERGYLASTYVKNGVKYEHVMNSKEYDAVVETIRYVVLTKSTYGKSGQNFDDTGTNMTIKPTAKMIAESPKMMEILTSLDYTEEAKAKLMEVAGIETVKSADGGKTKVVLVNNRLDNILEYVVKGLNKFQADGSIIEIEQKEGPKKDKYGVTVETEKDDDNKLDKSADMDENEFTENKQGGEYSKYSWEFDPITEATPRVKFFFARFADVQPTYVYDSETGTVKILATHRLNAAGLPQLTPYDRAWGTMLNQLYHCRGQLELWDRLKVLSTFDERYQPVYAAYDRLMKAAYEVDEESGSIVVKNGKIVSKIKDQDAYGLVKDIAKSIAKAKCIPNVTESMQSDTDPDLNGSLRVFESSMEYQIRDIRKSWSVAFASGQLEFIKRNPNGDLERANQKQLNKVIVELKQISKLFSNLSRGEKLNNTASLQLSIDCRTTHKIIDKKGKERTRLNARDDVKTVTITGTEILNGIEANDQTVLEAVKHRFVQDLNRIGILITVEDLEFCLEDRSGYLKNGKNVDRTRWEIDALVTFFDENQIGFSNTLNVLESLEHRDYGESFENLVTSIWNSGKGNKNSFIDTLSTAKYRRRSAEYQLSYITIGGKKQYAMGQHNAITDKIDELKRKDNETLTNLLNDPYHKESRALKFVEESHQVGGPLEQMKFVPLPGLKTDAHGSVGVEYLDLSEQEDVVTKYALLTDNQLILETLSDKTTWGSIKMPYAFGAFGIDWVTDKDDYNASIRKDKNQERIVSLLRDGKFEIRTVNGQLYFEFDNDVLDQFIAYAKSEYESAKLEASRKVEDKDKVGNFHKSKHKDKDGNEIDIIQGARMSSFTGIINDDGTFISFNNLYKTEQECLNDAEKYFFGLTKKNPDRTSKYKEIPDVEKQRHLMNNVLSHQLRKELEWLQGLGLISLENGQYSNVGLDKIKISKLEKWISASKILKNGYVEYYSSGSTVHEKVTVDSVADAMKYAVGSQEEHSKAVVMYVADMVAKAQMSHQEFCRMMGGNLSYYKWQYDPNTGNVIDTTQDFFKRMGGLVSTGEYNVVDDFEEDFYTCAEMEDEMFQSPMFEGFEEAANLQEFRKQLIQLKKDLFVVKNDKDELESRPITIETLNQDWAKEGIEKINAEVEGIKDVNELKRQIKQLRIDLEEKRMLRDGIALTQKMKKSIEKSVDGMIKSVEIRNKKQADALSKDKLDVNDGAAYITDEFCEKLLKAIGKWDKKIAKAFEILRSADGINDKNAREVADSYNTVYTTVIGTQKYTSFGFRPTVVENGDGVSYTRNDVYYDKPAFFPLFTCMATGHTKAVLKKMQDQKIDVLKTTGSIKVGGKGAVQCDSETFKQWDENPQSFKDFKFRPYTQRLQDLRKQFNTDPKDKEWMTLGSQYQKVVMLLLHAEQIYDVDGQQLDAREIRDQIMDCYTHIANAGRDKHNRKFYDQYGNLKIDIFVQQLEKQVDDRDASDQLKKYLDVEQYETTDPDDPDKTITKKRLKLPVSAMASTTWIQSIITSIINKELIDVNMPGQAFYQRSAWGVEGTMDEGLGNIISQEDWKYSVNHGAALQAKNEQGSMDVVLSIDFFNYIFEDHPGLKYQSFEAKKAWLIKNGIISGFIKEGDKDRFKDKDGNFRENEFEEIDGKLWHNAQTNIVGYRIPTQAPSSIHAMRCVDVIMAVRDTIIMPKEVTGITGSDFDIDKFFLTTLFYNTELIGTAEEDIKRRITEAGFENKKELRAAYEKAKTDENEEEAKRLANVLIDIDHIRRDNSRLTDKFDEKTNEKEHYCNKLVKTQITLLTTNDNNLSQLQGSIDVDTIPLKEAANEIRQKYGSEALMPFDATSLRVAVQAKLAFAIGKKGIGPFALNNNNHVFTVMYNVKFNDDEGILHDLDLLDLSKTEDRNGHSISSWISGLINAHVDVAKDPYIRTLGVNAYTYNLVNLLIRTGYGRETFWFTTQPIMWKLYDTYDKASGVYKQNESESKYTRTGAEIDKFFISYIKHVTGVSDISGVNTAEKKFDDYFAAKYGGLQRRDAIKALMKYDTGVQVMKTISTTSESQLADDRKFDIGMSQQIEYKDIQALVLIANNQLQKKAQELSDLVQYTKIDTKKQGKTVAEQHAYLAKMEGLMSPERSPFEIKSITNMIEHSFIGKKTRESIEAQRLLLRTQLIEATDGFSELVTSVKERLNSNRNDESFMQSVSDAIIAKLKSDYFFRGAAAYCAQRSINPRRLLMDEEESIHAQLQKIKDGILNKNDHRYDSVRDESGGCNNYLLNNLIGHFKNSGQFLYTVGDNTGRDFSRDRWDGALFIKNINVFDDFVKQSDMQNAWEDLLNDTSHPELQRFAEQLIVYAFITSASNGGKYDLFKYVPYSWITGDCELLKHSGIQTFADYIQRLIDQLNSDDSQISFSEEEIDEMILNFTDDDNLVTNVSKGRLNSMYSLTTTFGTPVIVGALSDEQATFLNGEYPGYFKVATNDYQYGQRKYNVYKCVAIGHYEQYKDGKINVIPYPIYVLVEAHGGVYKDGQKIYDMGIQEIPERFGNFWNSGDMGILLNRLQNSVDSPLDSISPERIFRQLLYIGSKEDGVNGITVSSLIPTGSPLETIVDSALRNGKTEVFSWNSWAEVYKNDQDSNRQMIDFLKRSTQLHLEKRENVDDEYKQSNINDIQDTGAFGVTFEDTIDKIRSKNRKLQIEYYKKSSSDGKYWKPTITISLRYGKALGFVEISAEIDEKHREETGEIKYTGEFSINFRMYDYNDEDNVTWASVPMTKVQKIVLTQAAMTILPTGSTVIITEEQNKIGTETMERLGDFYNDTTGLFEKTQNDDNVSWKKVKPSNFDKAPETNVPKYTKRIESQVQSLLEKAIDEQLTPLEFSGQLITPERVKDVIRKTLDANPELKQIIVKSSVTSFGLLKNLGYHRIVNELIKEYRIEDAVNDTENSCKIG